MKMVTTVLLVFLVIQFCVATSLLIQTDVQQENTFHPRNDMKAKVDLNQERNVPKVTLEWINIILYFIIAEPSEAFLPWTHRQPVKNPTVPLINTTNELYTGKCPD